MAKSSSVMQQESIETQFWAEAPITVYSDGSTSANIDINVAQLPNV